MTEKGNFIPLLFLRVALTFFALIPAVYYQQLVDIMAKATKTDANSIAAHGTAILLLILWIKLATIILNR